MKQRLQNLLLGGRFYSLNASIALRLHCRKMAPLLIKATLLIAFWFWSLCEAVVWLILSNFSQTNPDKLKPHGLHDICITFSVVYPIWIQPSARICHCGLQLLSTSQRACASRAYRPYIKAVYSYFEKGCRKKCTRLSQKVLWVVLSSLVFKEIWKNGTRGHGSMFPSDKGKQQK